MLTIYQYMKIQDTTRVQQPAVNGRKYLLCICDIVNSNSHHNSHIVIVIAMWLIQPVIIVNSLRNLYEIIEHAVSHLLGKYRKISSVGMIFTYTILESF